MISARQLSTPARTWTQALAPFIEQERLPDEPGNANERQALAMVRAANRLARGIGIAQIYLGALVNEIGDSGAHATLGYDGVDELSDAEYFGRVGRTQLYKYRTIARHSNPADLDADVLDAESFDFDTERASITVPATFSTRYGTENTYALVSQWKNSDPQERQEMLEHLDQPTREFARIAYKRQQEAYLRLDGDLLFLWEEEVGTPVARIIITDPRARELLESCLSRRGHR